jgi:hypothetical protein
VKEVTWKMHSGFWLGDLRERGNLEEAKRGLMGKFEGKR